MEAGAISFDSFTVAMLMFGFSGHILKKVVEARGQDETFSIKKYLTRYPYATALAFFTAAAAYLAMMGTDLLSPLNAFMAGYMANSMGDIVGTGRKG